MLSPMAGDDELMACLRSAWADDWPTGDFDPWLCPLLNQHDLHLADDGTTASSHGLRGCSPCEAASACGALALPFSEHVCGPG